jgi:hypothetical protein
MSPDDPTAPPLPCDGMLDETDVMIATVEGAASEALAMLRRHRAALVTCRSHCWLRGPMGELGGRR